MKRKNLSVIIWEDAAGTSGWLDVDSGDDGLMMIVSAGFVLREDKKVVTLIQSVGTDGKRYDNSITIPKSNILKRKSIARIPV